MFYYYVTSFDALNKVKLTERREFKKYHLALVSDLKFDVSALNDSIEIDVNLAISLVKHWNVNSKGETFSLTA